jgi:hypothetical protein
MDLNYHIDIPKSFSPKSKVWIYQSDRKLHENEVDAANELIQNFINQWVSHGRKVKGFGKIMFQHFIVLIADEFEFSVSGCSIDSSVRVIKDLEKKLDIDLFNRQNLAFKKEHEILIIQISKIKDAIDSGFISSDTIYFNNMITHLEDLQKNWLVSLGNSWLANRLNIKSLSR